MLCSLCFKSATKSFWYCATQWKSAPASLPSHHPWSHRPHHIPPSGSTLQAVGSYLVSPTEAVFAPALLYLSELPIIAPLHCRDTSNTELCMLLWLKQTKRISLFKELMLRFLHTQPPSSKDLRAGEVSLAVSCGWENWSMRRWNEFAYWMIIPYQFASHLTAHVLGQSPVIWHTAQTEAKPKKQGILWYSISFLLFFSQDH